MSSRQRTGKWQAPAPVLFRLLWAVGSTGAGGDLGAARLAHAGRYGPCGTVPE